MNNPSFPVKFRRQATDRASARFFDLAEAIAGQNEPTQTQLNALESSYQSTGDFLSECPEFSGILDGIHGHGSRQIGTTVRPVDESRDGFDIDLIARLNRNAMQKYGGENGPALLLRDLHNALSRYATSHNLELLRWDRCVTLKYAGGMFADIAPVIDDPLLGVRYGDTHGRIPDRALKNYSATNPRGYAKSFNDAAIITPNFGQLIVSFAEDSLKRAEVAPLPEAQKIFGRLLSRLVQLLKLHRNVSFNDGRTNPDYAPSSVFITTLAAIAYEQKAPEFHESPFDLLLDIVETMPNCFHRVTTSYELEEWTLLNPSAPGDNLASGMNTIAMQAAFRGWHKKLVLDLRAILKTIEDQSGLDVLLIQIEAAFGPRAAKAVRAEEAKQIGTQRKFNKVAVFGSAAIAGVSMPVRAHTFYGDL